MVNYIYGDSDNETYYESDYGTDYESSDDEFDASLYEPEEQSLTKYNIILCKLYNINIYYGSLNTHFLVMFRFKIFDSNIISSFNCLKPEIGECIYLPTGECVAILKTYWLKIIQRKWKNIIKIRNNTNKLRSNLNSIKYREIYGKWPQYCLHYPKLKGMLSDLV